jgi:hypothetical protein
MKGEPPYPSSSVSYKAADLSVTVSSSYFPHHAYTLPHIHPVPHIQTFRLPYFHRPHYQTPLPCPSTPLPLIPNNMPASDRSLSALFQMHPPRTQACSCPPATTLPQYRIGGLRQGTSYRHASSIQARGRTTWSLVCLRKKRSPLRLGLIRLWFHSLQHPFLRCTVELWQNSTRKPKAGSLKLVLVLNMWRRKTTSGRNENRGRKISCDRTRSRAGRIEVREVLSGHLLLSILLFSVFVNVSCMIGCDVQCF